MTPQMKAAQIKRYSKAIQIHLNSLPIPEIGPSDVLVRVQAAAVNPLDQLILTGSIRVIQDYPMPLTLGNECAGIVERTGADVTRFKAGDKVYACLPLAKIGAFAEYVAIDQHALAFMPEDCDFLTASAIPLTGLTAYQAFTEELEAQPGQRFDYRRLRKFWRDGCAHCQSPGIAGDCDGQRTGQGTFAEYRSRPLHRLPERELLGSAAGSGSCD